MRRLVNGRECEQCQIAQASTVRRDRNSDRAHLLLAQNRNKMQCDGLRNVWCSRSANNFCPAFRFQWFPIFFIFRFFLSDKQQPFPRPQRCRFWFFPLLHFRSVSFPTRVIDYAICRVRPRIVHSVDRVEGRRNKSSCSSF